MISVLRSDPHQKLICTNCKFRSERQVFPLTLRKDKYICPFCGAIGHVEVYDPDVHDRKWWWVLLGR